MAVLRYVCVAIAAASGLGCENDVVCTTSVDPGIVVTISDSVTGAPAAEKAGGRIAEGTYQELLRPFGAQGDPPVLVSLAGAFERPGRYLVQVSAPGYLDWQADNVRVNAGECHVRTVVLNVRLRRAQ